MDLYFSWKQWIEKHLYDKLASYKYEAFHKVLIDGLEWCGLLVDYCGFLSVWTHSDGTHSL